MEFEQILKLVDHVSASHLESFCYESDGVKLTLNNKIAPVIIPGTMQNNILSGAETGEKGFVYGEKYSISEPLVSEASLYSLFLVTPVTENLFM